MFHTEDYTAVTLTILSLYLQVQQKLHSIFLCMESLKTRSSITIS